VRVSAEERLRGALIPGDELFDQVVFGGPAVGILTDLARERIGDILRPLGSDVFHDQLVDQIRMHPGEDLHHSTAG